jgi:N-acetylated-alpha-linked acidic dipeptidase
LALLLALGVGAVPIAGSGPAVSLRGFATPAASREEEFERLFRSQPNPDQARHDLEILTREPHVAGTPADYGTAQYVLRQFRDAGLDAEIIEYQVLLPMPKDVKVELVAPVRYEAASNEGAEQSGSTGDDPSVIAAFNAFSPSGDITAPVVYANYGLPEDYDRLRELGISAAGKIVIARYGKCFRGVKATVAQMHHAAGLLIYSDPADDGFARGAVYPTGPWRPATAVQRGSILPLSAYSGDPLTPGVAATRDAKRLLLSQVPLPRIPTTPLSYKDAAPILKHLKGPRAPRDWRGGPPFFSLVKLEMDYRLRPIWDVVAKIPGAVRPEEWVVAGNHRDAWTYGAADPGSGTVSLIAVARGLGQLLKQGWKPRRTIVLASWDAEEFGLMGSTEWAEQNAENLARHAIAYLNVDVGVCGPHFHAAAVPSLCPLVREVAQDVTDPESGQSVLDAWSRDSGILTAEAGQTNLARPGQGPNPAPPEVHVRELGSGSDYTVFLEHLGVPSLDFGFSGPYGVYHSRFDDFDWMRRFGDPTFRYSVAEAQIYGMLVMRLADAEVLPFDYQEYGEDIQEYLHNFELENEREHPGKELNLQSALLAATEFTRMAGELQARVAEAERNGSISLGELSAINQALLDVERNFLLDKGLPGRPWFRHAFFAPGVYTGYAAVILPGVREAIDRNDWATARLELALVEKAIERGTATLNRALETLSLAPQSRGTVRSPGWRDIGENSAHQAE